jgi:hypothetical protein
MLFGSEILEQSMGLPATLLRFAGASLFPFAALLIYLAMKKNVSLPTTWAVIILNALWVFDSILLLLIGWIDPTVLGTAFVIFQAAGVALFASLEYVGLRKSLPYFGQTTD